MSLLFERKSSKECFLAGAGQVAESSDFAETAAIQLADAPYQRACPKGHESFWPMGQPVVRTLRILFWFQVNRFRLKSDSVFNSSYGFAYNQMDGGKRSVKSTILLGPN